MNIYPVKPHKRIILNYDRNVIYVKIPESSFLVNGIKIYYGIIQHDCLIATNLGLALNCGGWKRNIKDDQTLMNKFWNTKFPFWEDEVRLCPALGIIPLKDDFDLKQIKKLVHKFVSNQYLLTFMDHMRLLRYRKIISKANYDKIMFNNS